MERTYSDLKALGFLDRLVSGPDGRIAAPVHVRIKPINRCNHSCWFCAYRADGLDLGDQMDDRDRIPDGKMFEIVRDLVRIGVRAVTFSGGGEPLLYKKLPEIIEMLGRGGVRVGALSNGSNLQGSMADAFARYGTWLRVSIDGGDDSSYAAARGLRVERRPFSRLLENLAAFTARGSPCELGVSYIVHEQSAPHLYEACLKFKAAGVRHVKLSGVVVGNDVAANQAYHGRLAELVSGQIRQAKELESPDFTVVDHYHAMTSNFAKGYHTCPMARLLTVIGADCQVYACQDKAYTESGRLGSIRDRSFAEFWFSEENRQALEALDPAESCRHHCVAHRKNLLLDEYLSLRRDHAAFV
ncbi:MAG: radical SAM protein [Alphaproteobacteria bacterium]|nr:radical SAM protein [Alphaproteobacteria bacterium]